MTTDDLTQLLQGWSAGDRDAEQRLLPMVYDELRQIAARHMQLERPGHTLQPTELVHEAYLRLQGQRDFDWKSRRVFYSLASQVMRHILVDYARRRNTARRGGGQTPVTLDTGRFAVQGNQFIELLALDAALRRIEKVDPTKARIIEMRVFGGLSFKEIREVLGCSRSTVGRHWKVGRIMLAKALRETARDDATVVNGG